MSRKKKNGVSTETKTFIRQKFEAAKWFIASIYQRRDTMLRVMRTIVDKQRDFFEVGEGLKPMIYKDIAEVIAPDVPANMEKAVRDAASDCPAEAILIE